MDEPQDNITRLDWVVKRNFDTKMFPFETAPLRLRLSGRCRGNIISNFPAERSHLKPRSWEADTGRDARGKWKIYSRIGLGEPGAEPRLPPIMISIPIKNNSVIVI